MKMTLNNFGRFFVSGLAFAILFVTLFALPISKINAESTSVITSVSSAPRILKLTIPQIKGDDVKELQTFLNNKGYDVGIADGYFGPKTQSAVILFQKANNLTPDGFVGPKTRAIMNSSSIFNSTNTQTLTSGCTSSLGFSTITGNSCAITLVAYTAGCASGALFNTVTGQTCAKITLPTGCSPVANFSTTTGLSCYLPVGCNSTLGYSITTGLSCVRSGFTVHHKVVQVDEISTYSLTYTPGAHGSITGTLSQTVNSGIDGTEVIAIPNTGYHFVDWSDSITTINRTDTNVTANVSVTANFEVDVPDTFTLGITTAGTGSGTTTGAETYSFGTVVTLTNTPDTGSTFGGWTGDADCTDGSVTVDANKTCTATFTINSYTVTFDTNTGDTDADPTTKTADYNGNVGTLPTAPTKTGYIFDSWNTQANGLGTTFNTSTAVTNNTTVYAKWTAITPITAIGVITGTTTTGSVLTAGVLTPSEATVTYQWQSATTSGGTYTDISSATASTYTLVSTDLGKYIKVSATGTGSYSGTITSIATAVILGNITFTYNGSSVTYGTVYNPITTKVWLDRNLGATQVATSSTDYLAYGDLFQWGRPADGHQLIDWTNSTTGAGTNVAQTGQVANVAPGVNYFLQGSSDWSSIDSDGAIRSAYLAKTDGTSICPAGFRVPLDTELDAERVSWVTSGSTNDSAGAFASPLKFTVAGLRSNTDDSFLYVGREGYYWSSSVSGTDSRRLYFGSVGSGEAFFSSSERAYGRSVRCLKD